MSAYVQILLGDTTALVRCIIKDGREANKHAIHNVCRSSCHFSGNCVFYNIR